MSDDNRRAWAAYYIDPRRNPRPAGDPPASSWTFGRRLRWELRAVPGLWLLVTLSVVLGVATMLVPLAWKFQCFGAACWCAGYVVGRA